MKKVNLIISALFIYFTCVAQEYVDKDSIQICYKKGSSGIGGYDNCVTIYFENDILFCKRVCYSIFNDMRKYIVEADAELSQYYEVREQAILRHYKESDNYLILDERVEISKFQFDELTKIINEIKAFVSEVGNNSDEIIISTAGSSHFVIKDKSGTAIISDWLGRYNRKGDIENVLGLKSYLRCPCVEEDLKLINNNRKRTSFWQRIRKR